MSCGKYNSDFISYNYEMQTRNFERKKSELQDINTVLTKIFFFLANVRNKVRILSYKLAIVRKNLNCEDLQLLEKKKKKRITITNSNSDKKSQLREIKSEL